MKTFFSETTMVDKNVAMTMTRYPRPVKIASALCRACRDDHPINEPSHMHLMICSMSGYANGTAQHSCLCCCFLLMVLVVTMSAVDRGWTCQRMCLHDVGMFLSCGCRENRKHTFTQRQRYGHEATEKSCRMNYFGR